MAYCGKPGMTSELRAEYDAIISKCSTPEYIEKYHSWLLQMDRFHNYRSQLTTQASILGLKINFETGRISYDSNFVPLSLPFELCFVRHGQTIGNTEPRIFQGQIDYEINQLTESGVKGAQSCADSMDAQNYLPDVIFASPLGRAYDTGRSFSDRHSSIPFIKLNAVVEMAFGDWDGREVRTFAHDDLCHTFYVHQNAVIKANEAHVLPNGVAIPSECFIEVVARMKQALLSIAEHPVYQSIASKLSRPVKVCIFSHSMAGAASLVVLGKAKAIVDSATQEEYLGFDGQHIMPHTTPFFL